MIAQGKYEAMPIAWGLVESKSDSNPEQYAIDFEILTEGEHAGETIALYGAFSDAAFQYTMQKIRAAGLVGDDLRALQRNTDKPVRITIKHEEYQGKTRAKVAFVDGGGAVAAHPLPADRAASFSERMKQRIKAFDAKAGSPSPSMVGTRRTETNAAGRGREPGDDDIPQFDDIPFGR